MKYLKYLILSAVAVAAVFPFIWLVSTSLKGAEDIFSFSLIPAKLVPENYSGVWNAVPFARYLLNSIIVVTSTVVLNVVFASLSGFALARFNFRGKNIFILLMIAAMMVPKELIIIPVYTTVLKLRLADTLAGVIIPFAVEGFAIFMMRQAFLAIPKEIEDAAVMDGCSPFRLWWSVMSPMTKPALATLAVFTFIGSWGDFLWPLIVLKSPENYTLQIGLSNMLGTFVNNYRFVAAGSVLALAPVIILYLFAQKYFERGLFSGAGK